MSIVITITEPLGLSGATSLAMAVNAPAVDVPVFRSGGIFSWVGFSRTSVTGPVMANTSMSSVGLIRTSVTAVGLEN